MCPINYTIHAQPQRVDDLTNIYPIKDYLLPGVKRHKPSTQTSLVGKNTHTHDHIHHNSKQNEPPTRQPHLRN